MKVEQCPQTPFPHGNDRHFMMVITWVFGILSWTWPLVPLLPLGLLVALVRCCCRPRRVAGAIPIGSGRAAKAKARKRRVVVDRAAEGTELPPVSTPTGKGATPTGPRPSPGATSRLAGRRPTPARPGAAPRPRFVVFAIRGCVMCVDCVYSVGLGGSLLAGLGLYEDRANCRSVGGC